MDTAGLVSRLLEKLLPARPPCAHAAAAGTVCRVPGVPSVCRSVSLWPVAGSPAGEACWVNPAIAAHEGSLTMKQVLVSGAAYTEGPEMETPRPGCPGGQVTWRGAQSVGKRVQLCSSGHGEMLFGHCRFSVKLSFTG